MSNASRAASILMVLVPCVACDQATKHVASMNLQGRAPMSFLGDTFRLQYALNPGAFLGLGGALPEGVRSALFTTAVGVALLAMLVWAWRARLPGPQWTGVLLVVAGGLGNWVDRVRSGAVVDFMNMGVGSLRTGIFNVADVAIMAGAFLMIWRFGPSSRTAPPDASPPGPDPQAPVPG